MNRVLIIVNPSSGSFSELSLERVKSVFHKKEVSVAIYRTKKAGDGAARAKRARGNYDAVIAMGGDGTVNEVVNGLAGSKTPLGIIPSGTENVLAQDLKIPRMNITKAAKIILKEKRKRIDLGVLKEKEKHYFAFVAGAGFDAHVTAKTKPFLKKIVGSVAYPLTAFREFFTYDPPHITVEANGKVYGGTLVLICNSRLYGATLSFAPKAKMDDGKLDFCILQNTDLFSALKYAFAAKIRKVGSLSDVVTFQAKKAKIQADKAVLVHTDAEIRGKTPFTIEVCEKCLDVLIP